MALVNVAWVAENRTVPPTVPPLDSWKVAIGLPGAPDIASVVINDLTVRAADLDVSDGVGYIATVGLISADGSVTGPAASSVPFDVATLPVPVSVSVTIP